ncbi:MAG TPA: DUF998 domain-containing protein [Chloroflexota bacterium]
MGARRCRDNSGITIQGRGEKVPVSLSNASGGSPTPTPHIELGTKKLRSIRLLALGAQLGIDGFIVLVVLLHFLRPDLDPGIRTVSEYAIGRYGLLMTTAFFLLGLGSVALAALMAWVPEARSFGRLLPWLMILFALAVMVCGIFRTDTTIPGSAVTIGGGIHKAAADVAMYAGCAMMALTGLRSLNDKRWSVLSGCTLAMLVLGLGTWAFLETMGYSGWAERALIAAVVLWFAGIAVRTTHDVGAVKAL